MTPKATMLRAVELLREDAQLVRDSCERATDPPRQWDCDDCVKDEDGKCQAQRESEERERIAASVEALAKAFA